MKKRPYLKTTEMNLEFFFEEFDTSLLKANKV